MRQELVQEIRLDVYNKKVKAGLTHQQIEELLIEAAYDRACRDFRVGRYVRKRDYNQG